MISIAYDQKRYHQLLSDLVKLGDTVIEIGPHLGASTKVIAGKAGKVIAIDKGKQSAEAFKSMPKNVFYIHGDARLFETVDMVLRELKQDTIPKTQDPKLKTQDTRPKTRDRLCDLLAIDMGGGRFPDTVFKVWSIWSGVFKPRDSVIRNFGLAEFLRRAKISDPSLETDYPDSGWLTRMGRKTPSQLKQGLDEMRNWMVEI